MAQVRHAVCPSNMPCDVIKWKHFPRYWPFVREIHRSPVNTLHKGQWHGALMFSFIRFKGWVNNRETGDLRCNRAHYDVTVMRMAVAWFVLWCLYYNVIRAFARNRINLKSINQPCNEWYKLVFGLKWTIGPDTRSVSSMALQIAHRQQPIRYLSWPY